MRAVLSATAVALLMSSCSFSPLNHRIKVGEEPYVVLVGEGVDHHTDLFAVPADGGPVSQFTFTPLIERMPRLTSSGEVVAFLRMRDTMPATQRDVVVMNLLSGGEVTLKLPATAGQPLAIAWNRDASSLDIRTDRGLWQAAAPPSVPAVAPVSPADTAAADSLLDVWVGQPRFARIVDCVGGGLCSIGPKGDTESIAPGGSGAIRWGDDSVAWFENHVLRVRSLGPGTSRQLLWQNPPTNPRDATYAPGAPPTSP